eukprot:jgi/Psemu1/293806/fgenesh1_pg.4429_\
MRIDGTDGNIGVNVAPNTAARLTVTSTGTENAINANTANATGRAILATNTAVNGVGIVASGSNSGILTYAGVGGNFNGGGIGGTGTGTSSRGIGFAGIASWLDWTKIASDWIVSFKLFHRKLLPNLTGAFLEQGPCTNISCY